MTSSSCHIAALQSDQAEELGNLARHIWHKHYPGIISLAQIDYMLCQRYDATQIKQQLGQPGSWWKAAWNDTDMIGFSHYFLDDDPHRIKLDKIYVHPGWQRLGVGAALLKQVESEARRQDRHILGLRTNKHNQTALAAYRKYGFIVVEAVVTEIGAGFVMDDYVLEKVLD